MPINCSLSCWWYDLLKMVGSKITLKFVLSIYLQSSETLFSIDISSGILFACLFVSMFFFFLVSFELYCFRFRHKLLFEFALESQIIFSCCCRLCLWNKSSWISWIHCKPQFSKQLSSIQQICMEYYS